MKQIVQNMGSGETIIVDAPSPLLKEGHLLIQSKISVISAGTEKMLVEFGKSNLLEKARKQPEKVLMVTQKIQSDGLFATIDAVRSKLDQPIPLGYSNCGVVIAVGEGVKNFSVGDRVISNGGHADLVRIPQNLCARVPDNVTDEEAAFTVISAIGLQGIRLAQPTLGESFAVFGLGLIGLCTVQLLRAHGCRVLGIDFNQSKLALAKAMGAETVDLSNSEDPVAAGLAFSRSKGMDGVIVTASTTSNELMSQAAKMSRKRGRIILVGVTGLELSRADFYEKELTFQVSCSYGPGRYDSEFEDKGRDYPFAFVRWTEQRNFEAILDMMESGALDVKPLISHRVSFEKALEAYQTLSNDPESLGILLQYPEQSQETLLKKKVLLPQNTPIWKRSFGSPSKVVCGFIGAGNYASRILIPAFSSAKANLNTLVTSGGISGVHFGVKAGFQSTSTDVDAMLETPAINTVVIATQHNTHARFVIKALQKGKNVFVEKPLAIHSEDLDKIEQAYREAHQKDPSIRLMVGFNRRFAPQVVQMKELMDRCFEPKSLIMTVNAGAIPKSNWNQDPLIGGGRIIGEGCHFVDLMRFLVGHPITSVQALAIGNHPSIEVREDKASILLGFEDGSMATIHYLANGSKAFPKERIEVFSGGGILQLDNYRKMQGFDWPNFKKMNQMVQDKGQKECAAVFVNSIQNNKACPIPFNEIMEVSKATIDIDRLLKTT